MAIDDLLDEHEQSERVRSWLRKNGASILGGVVIAIGAIAGWQWYQKDQGGKLASANVEYQKALVGLQQNKLDDAAKAVKALEAGPSSIYGDLAALQLAKAAVAAGVQILLAQQGLTLSALDALYLSGGFGMYLDPASAAAIGMLPRLPAAKLHSVGNAALSGAAQLALRGDMSAAYGIGNRLTYLELSGRPDFADAFAKNIPLRSMQWR